MAALRAREWETEAYGTDRITNYLQGKQSPQQAEPERAAFAALDGTALVGFVVGHRTRRLGGDAELQGINVAKASRGKGIAQKLIGQIGAWFAEQGARHICVNVEPDNVAARSLYQRYGAQPFKSHWTVWEDSRAMLPAVNEPRRG
ncbi:MAG: GNAT family N-acetyltransferase [Acidobacteriia bacterium]|nr:GNAT family N-acetyltransferase [Terriglobia bacterium]